MKSKLRRLMEERKITCKELASEIGVTAGLVSKWRQSDRGMPSLVNLDAVCKVLGCNPVDIFPEAHKARGKHPCKKCGVVPEPTPYRYKRGDYVCNPCFNEYRQQKSRQTVYSPASTYGRPGVGVDDDLFFDCSTLADERPPRCTGKGYGTPYSLEKDGIIMKTGLCAECIKGERRVVYF